MLVIEKDDMRKIIYNNDVKSLTDIFDAVGFDGGEEPYYDALNSPTIQNILVYASVSARREKLSTEMAHLLIDRLAMSCKIFDFLRFTICATGVQSTDFDNMQGLLKDALTSNTYCKHISTIIRKLRRDVFDAMMVFIVKCDDVTTLDLRFNKPILKYVYDQEVMPHDQMLSMWAAALIIPQFDNIGYGALDGTL